MLNILGLGPWYSTVENWIASFKMSKFFIEEEYRSERPLSLSFSENVNTVYDLIWSDCRIELKRIFEALKVHLNKRVHRCGYDKNFCKTQNPQIDQETNR